MRNLNDLARIAAQLNAATSVVWRDATNGRFVRQPYTTDDLAFFRKPLSK